MKKIIKILGMFLLGLVLLVVIAIGIHKIKERVEMKDITADSKLCSIYNLPELKPVKDYLMYMSDSSAMSLGSHFIKIGSLDANGNVLYGLERLREVISEGQVPISIYEGEDISDDPEKGNANIMFFPSSAEVSDKPFVVVIAGGGYMTVSNLLESYPTARKLNELGYPVFVLNYRIDNSEGLFPKPMEDLAQALKYIYSHTSDFGIAENQDYIVGGYSAGGHISAEWGTDNEGYLKYGIKAPKALFLGYPAIAPDYFVSEEQPEEMKAFRESIVGADNYEELAEEFSADQHVHSDYPPVYIVYCKDDDMVDPILHSQSMINALEAKGINYRVEVGETGGHGFAVGFGTSVEGWIERADSFFESLD